MKHFQMLLKYLLSFLYPNHHLQSRKFLDEFRLISLLPVFSKFIYLKVDSFKDYFASKHHSSSRLEFIDIILSVQQEKSGVQMNQSCTINISCATAIACSTQYMR